MAEGPPFTHLLDGAPSTIEGAPFYHLLDGAPAQIEGSPFYHLLDGAPAQVEGTPIYHLVSMAPGRWSPSIPNKPHIPRLRGLYVGDAILVPGSAAKPHIPRKTVVSGNGQTVCDGSSFSKPHISVQSSYSS